MLIANLQDLAGFLATVGPDPVVFRGQADASWGLVPSMYRGLSPAAVEDWSPQIADAERDIFREFNDKSRLYRQGGDAWEILVLAQHYGTPTRLIDWTTNAHTALYFAAAASPATDGALWCAVPA